MQFITLGALYLGVIYCIPTITSFNDNLRNTAMMWKTTSCHVGMQVNLCLDLRILPVCAVA